MSLKKHEMPSQAPEVRNKNFLEVALGYSAETAIEEAKRCLNCKHKPCIGGCPVRIHIPEFIAKVAEGAFEEAYQIIQKTSSLPRVCGRVARRKRSASRNACAASRANLSPSAGWNALLRTGTMPTAAISPSRQSPTAAKWRWWAAGPAGLTCAGDLAKRGYDVTVFEALHLAGGVLVYGIPEFRLPKSIVQKEIDNLKALGVKVENQHGHRPRALHRRTDERIRLRSGLYRQRRGPFPDL